ncbi:DUF4249 domain-containing protein [Elizabethkingia anophelis]|uniref:DUF4249 domain-containing protein n=1 Tax=Elizabethkingia TaxID=308865 RepID=UPI0007398532|nr:MULTISPECIES: DUF4249 domain-containing protein [Elizabethkingia]KUF46662.1 hypothetical protein AS358_09395 [Elizabethkingia anophelis]MCT3644987.1 DUF4249 domain-containing protein [Elizabethkingia anophelis]MCT3651637.1 DUF4249 domain-containing protein [Elizabethkingia anophelis]MCT3655987.1 DUF4249 domain-containing protein [Elizabethkingia anophelis]MCT3658882.1 DUF4249 domain-containing protein [Elizabethkingia anophelis]
MKNLFFTILSLFFVISCEKEINLDLDNQSGKIVIEGNITDQIGPYYVRITKSVAFTEANKYPAIENAKVILSDDAGQTETLQYVGDGNYKTSTFRGESGRVYTLKIQAEGKEYTAQSTMPEVVPFDDLEQDSFMVGGEISYTLLPIFTDPPTLGNRYLFSYDVNNRSKKIFREFSDNINNGMINQRPLILPNDDDDGNVKVKAGDTINVEMHCIDEKIYTYYSALLQLSGGGGVGGGITPTNPPSNIDNGALGYFSAHTVRKRSKIIQ